MEATLSETLPVTQTKQTSAFKRATSWLWPTNRDSLLLLGCGMVLLSLLDPVIEQYMSVLESERGYGTIWFGLAGAFGAALGVVATAAWRRLDPPAGKRVLVFSFLAILAFLYSVYLTWGTTESSVSGLIGHSAKAIPVVVGPGWEMFWARFLGGALFAGLVLFLMIRSFIYALNRTKSKANEFELTRAKIMIGLAGFLFALCMMQKVLFPNGYVVDWDLSFSKSSGANWGVIGLAGVLGLLFASALSWVFCVGKSNVWKHVGLFFMLPIGLVGATFFAFSQRGIDSVGTRVVLASVIALIAFLWTITVVNETGNEASRIGRKNWPSLWAVFAILFAISSPVIMFFYDPAAAIAGNWDTARFSRVLRFKSDGQARLRIFTLLGFSELVCDFRNGVDPDLFKDQQVPGLAVTSIANLRGDLDTTSLAFQQLSLKNSKISSKQLFDLANAPWLVHLEDIEIVDPDLSVALIGRQLRIVSTENDKHLGSLLRTIKSADSAVVTVQGSDLKEFTREELDEIVLFSQRVPVKIQTSMVRQMVDLNYSSELSMQNLVLDHQSAVNIRIKNELRDYLLSHDVGFVFHKQISEAQLFWDIAFAKGESGIPNYQNAIDSYILSDVESFSKMASDFGWQFGVDENKQITHLFLPNAEPIVESPVKVDLTALETLCFDPAWLSGLDPFTGTVRDWRADPGKVESHLLSGMVVMPNLKRLVLGRKIGVSDVEFLKKIPAVEHLQVGFSKSARQQVDFSVCPNLKTLVFFDIPTKSVMAQLRKLNQLESVIIVDLEEIVIERKDSVANLVKAIPGVEIKVVKSEEFRAHPTEKFREFAKERAIESRKRIDLFDQRKNPGEFSGDE